MASKQKLIFYLSFLKSKNPITNRDLWQPETLAASSFIDLFANDRMYQKISQSQKVHLKEALMKSKVVIRDMDRKKEEQEEKDMADKDKA